MCRKSGRPDADPRRAQGPVSLPSQVARAAISIPIHVYRWTLKPLIGMECRHDPTCSAYALEAIALNGAWRGFWLGLSRIWRCSPWGTAGYDVPPDIRDQHHPLAPWRYGRWTRRAIEPARTQDHPNKE